jgi:hypothetical protein
MKLCILGILFDGSMTNMTLFINSSLIGYGHRVQNIYKHFI